MLRSVVRLASIGLRPLRRDVLTSADREAMLSWLGRMAPRWARGRVWMVAGFVASMAVGASAGWFASLPAYQTSHVRLWDERFDSYGELWEDLVGDETLKYGRAFAVHGFWTAVFAASAVLVWLRLGARAALRNRERCCGCGHELCALPLSEPSSEVRCPECGRLNPVIKAWNEVELRPDGVRVFRPAPDLVRALWTRQRVVMAAKGAGLISLTIGTVWGGVWAYRLVDSHQQASAARAARLSPDEITRRIKGAGLQTVVGGESRDRIAGRIALTVRTITRSFHVENGLAGIDGPRQQVWVEQAVPIRSTQVDPAVTENARLLLERVRASGLEKDLDQLKDAPVEPWKFVPLDEGVQQISGLGDVRQCLRFNMALLRRAVVEDDLGGFRRLIDSGLALVDVSKQGGFLIHTLVANTEMEAIAANLDWAARQRPEPPWLDEVDRGLGLLDVTPMDRVFEAERLLYLDGIAAHFSDPARIRRGLSDPSLEDPQAALSIFTVPNEGTRLGTFRENVRATNEAFECLIASCERAPWRENRYSQCLPANGQNSERPLVFELHFTAPIPALATALRASDRCLLLIRSARVSSRIERFRHQHGRVPTPAEFGALFESDADAIDPYSGKSMCYRNTDFPPIAAPRGYLLWCVGIDGEDDGARVPSPPDAATRANGSGYDVVVPDSLLH